MNFEAHKIHLLPWPPQLPPTARAGPLPLLRAASRGRRRSARLTRHSSLRSNTFAFETAAPPGRPRPRRG
eukprot:6416585-Lingulodinium_polyedra.AAC.1